MQTNGYNPNPFIVKEGDQELKELIEKQNMK